MATATPGDDVSFLGMSRGRRLSWRQGLGGSPAQARQPLLGRGSGGAVLTTPHSQSRGCQGSGRLGAVTPWWTGVCTSLQVAGGGLHPLVSPGPAPDTGPDLQGR